MSGLQRATLVLASAVGSCGCGTLVDWVYPTPSGTGNPSRSRYWTALNVDLKFPGDRQRAEQLFRAAATRLGFHCRSDVVEKPARPLLLCVPKDQDDGQFHLSVTELRFAASDSCASIAIDAYSKEGSRPPGSYQKVKWAILEEITPRFGQGIHVYGGGGYTFYRFCGS